jgi:hypothetical protein
MSKTIYFDMDGTIVDLYGVEGWLDMLLAEDTAPYDNAKPLINFSTFARYVHKLQAQGHKVGIISWLSKDTSESYSAAVTQAKRKYLAKHLPSVVFDEIHIIPYGTPKSTCISNTHTINILFDDEYNNKIEWIKSTRGYAFSPISINGIIKTILQGGL